ncbi:MAG: aminotransferase class I/II-fold pyridoxal phosphate-dependent enzyme, partial [Lachnospiraceae bacterium]|nr:aminotransferase class I/II-fold pyridoxal phosphate-dependent enzyme [Lachnospiraceae bacterium]
MNQQKTPLLEAVRDLIDTKPAYFRIPGHRLERGISSRWTEQVGSRIFSYDVTETPYTDDLHAPKGAIREAQELLRDLYGADESFFLVNGTTCGNEAMIISAAFEEEEIMVARNAHKSAMMGLVLSGAKPVYIMPEVIGDWGLQGAIPPERVRVLFKEHPHCSALFLVSPTYYGICSDLQKIADICHENNALLLVDEAHGAHLYFDKMEKADKRRGALECGADICVQSMHKVTGALTQSSVLHIKNHGVREDALLRVAENLKLVQSTSPSYLLMISLDCARYEL